jgi:hypothetical protein
MSDIWFNLWIYLNELVIKKFKSCNFWSIFQTAWVWTNCKIFVYSFLLLIYVSNCSNLIISFDYSMHTKYLIILSIVSCVSIQRFKKFCSRIWKIFAWTWYYKYFACNYDTISLLSCLKIKFIWIFIEVIHILIWNARNIFRLIHISFY